MIGQSLSLVSLEKNYTNIKAVCGISLDIKAGEFVSILGPSGSGKTSILTMIAGFEMPTAGRIVIGGRDVTILPPNHRDIGMVFQKYALFPHLTVAQNVAFPLKMRRYSKKAKRDRVDEMLELVQLQSCADRYPDQLSGGQQQRVALARSLAFEPPVILMDEPLGALDKKLREAMQFEIKRLQQRLGATVVYVTHDQEEALTMSDRVAVMSNGTIAQIGTPVELYKQPRSPFVANFIGKINFIEGRYLGEETGAVSIRLSQDSVVTARHTGQCLEPGTLGNQGVRLAIRPERIKLVARGAGGTAAIPGVVNTSVFVGSFSIFLVHLAGQPDQVIQVQIAAQAAPPFLSNDEVDLVPDEGAVHIFPATAEQAA